MPIKNIEKSPNLVREAVRIADTAKEKGIIVAIMGACAIWIRCPQYRSLHDSFSREITDIDLATYSKYKKGISHLLEESGYEPQLRYIALHGESRLIYHIHDGSHIDVFIDKLEMCHTLNFKNRLELCFPTLTPSDLLLEKMQIVQINEKDIKDTIVLLLENDIGEEEDTINSRYICKLLAIDWGFYYTVTNNLSIIKKFVNHYSIIKDKNKKEVGKKIDQLLVKIEDEPKSLSWKLRARVGTKKKWYQDVE